MNQVLQNLAADLVAIKHKEEELLRSGHPFQFSRMEPYVPSEEVVRLNQAQVEYHQKVKDLSFGQY